MALLVDLMIQKGEGFQCGSRLAKAEYRHIYVDWSGQRIEVGWTYLLGGGKAYDASVITLPPAVSNPVRFDL